VVNVEHEAQNHATLLGPLESGEQRVAGALVQAQVVEGNVQRFRCAVEEGSDPLRNRVSGLAAVVEKKDVERIRGGY